MSECEEGEVDEPIRYAPGESNDNNTMQDVSFSNEVLNSKDKKAAKLIRVQLPKSLHESDEELFLNHKEPEISKHPTWCVFCSFDQSISEVQLNPAFIKLRNFIPNNYSSVPRYTLGRMAQKMYNRYVRGQIVKPEYIHDPSLLNNKRRKVGNSGATSSMEPEYEPEVYVNRPMYIEQFLFHFEDHQINTLIIEEKALRAYSEMLKISIKTGVAQQDESTGEVSLNVKGSELFLKLVKETTGLSNKIGQKRGRA